MTIDEIAALWEEALRADLTDRAGLEQAAAFERQLRSWLGNEPGRFEAFTERIGDDPTWWLWDLASTLSIAGRVDEAIEYCDRWAPFGNADAFLSEKLWIMSRAGRHREAFAAADALVARFPELAWCHVFAADAYHAGGDDARAEAGYLRALELEPVDEHTVEGVLKRLGPLLEGSGRADEARRIAGRARSRLR